MAAALRHRDRPGDLAAGRADPVRAPASRPPAVTGRVLCALLQTSWRQPAMRPSASVGLQLDHHRRAERLPAMLLLAHPLQAHRAGRAPRGRRGRRRRRHRRRRCGRSSPSPRYGCSAPCSARQAQQLGQGLAQRIDALAVRPDRDAVVLPERHGAGRPDRAMHQAGPAVARLDHACHRRAPAARDRRRSALPRRQATDRLAHVFCRQRRRPAAPSRPTAGAAAP